MNEWLVGGKVNRLHMTLLIKLGVRQNSTPAGSWYCAVVPRGHCQVVISGQFFVYKNAFSVEIEFYNIFFAKCS